MLSSSYSESDSQLINENTIDHIDTVAQGTDIRT